MTGYRCHLIFLEFFMLIHDFFISLQPYCVN